MAKNETHSANASLGEGNGAKDEETVPSEVSDNAVNASPPKSVGFILDTKVAEENTDDIDAAIEDALDEGYMGMECTLERGFSLNESTIARDLRHERYGEVAVKYRPDKSLRRYRRSAKHFIPVRKSTRAKDEMPVDEAGLYSFIFISWITNLMWKAYKTGLKDDDVPLCSKYDMCEYNTDRLEILWNAEVKRKGKEGASIQYVLWQFYRTRFIFGLFIFSLTIILGFIGPITFMRYLISWLSSDEPLLVGFYWAAGLVLTELMRVILFCMVWSINYRNGIRLRAACLGILYRKLMRMSSLGNRSVGEVINLFANDAQRIFDFVVIGPMIVGGPLVAVGGVIYILWLLGPWALFGMVAFLLFYPFQYGISRLTGYLRRKTVTVTDERVRMMNELLNCVKLIKMYAWEKSFATSVSGIRGRERHLLEKSAYVQSLSLAMAPTVPIISAIVTFLAHIGAGYNLTAAQAMTVITFFIGRGSSSFNSVRRSVRVFVEGNLSFERVKAMTTITFFLGRGRSSFDMLRFSVRAFVEGSSSFERVKRMLLMDELTPYRGHPKDPSVAVAFHDATLGWDAVSLQKEKKNNKSAKKKDVKNDATPSQADQLLQPQDGELQHIEVLFKLSLSINKGELVGVCGGVGAGKSSLISAVLGHMRLKSGQVDLQGTCGYVGQQAWVLNATLRDNILLDEPFDAKRYYRVIHSCSLTQDIEVMPAGDMTEIGERGINLSGGQKQRVSLARALYADREVYLLDDPLSAVDANVGSHLFQWVIKRALHGKTTIFVTHQLQYLPQCDRVLLLQDGRIVGFDSHVNLLEDSVEYATLYKAHMDTVEKEEHEKDEFSPQPRRRRQDSTMSTGSERNSLPDKSLMDDLSDGLEEGKGVGQLISEEKLNKGDIPWSTYNSYIQSAGGYIVSTLVISTFLLNVGSTSFSSWWLSMWLSAGSGNTTVTIGNETYISDSLADNPDRPYYQTVYGSFILVILATSLIRGFAFTKTTLRASSRMHDQVFLKVFYSPMSFFDTTPSGRIINIFSRDMDEVDVRVPMTLEMFIQNMFLIASALLFVCLVFPHFLPVLVVLAVIMMFIRNIFRIGIRDFKRLENVSRSPLYSHISTTVNGLPSINAYGKQELFTKKFSVFFDENSCAFYLFNCAMRWLAVRLDLLALCVTTSTAMLALFLRGTVDASFAGLALAYAAQLSGIFQYTVRLSTETEARFTSVQRLHDCSKVLASEAPPIIESNRPDASWPKHGRISFKKVQMKYRHDTPLVLKGITFHIDSMEKIGVVGRTGSGKSSLGTALFRLVELSAGYIRIDGIDISTVGLEDLRSRLSIIPQDPVLFIGTVRYNLDPFESHTDEEIWLALEQTYMKDRISTLELGLSSPVVENGENFSVGERQLLCMARVLLRNSKILFLDEATAAIDTETDNKIQQTLKNAFKQCTMITIAHRLNTVMSCSRIMVLDDGKVTEFDTPRTLLANPDSMFAKMVAKSEASFIT
ncbi:ATP-binding cassette sub-family C member 5-like isoform X6 [Eriocheir sinensis]|uniref:ATP-binding cassette sub-family C member 5-like isoform X4 n=1 Tax=Eriocheir sinensis TaxID=95602 RepID=UPI0021C8F94D|nr:ATP-binding cassette sub-family C member 5-like isoform X4 [Eriocheir sinensis]XP_050718605.1 ATP-binding cassette sub-family C member 5-like isoform X6 [Eriocheir sinensis]